MRDLNRIPIVLEVVKQVWERYPDLRLGQLIYNVTRQVDLFNVEDDKLIELLDAWSKQYDKTT